MQFHFHAPSEHAVNGELYDLEVHFVHTVRGSEGPNGDLAEMPGAVIGVFFDREAGGDYDNAFLDTVFAAIDSRTLTSSQRTKVALRDFLMRIDMSEYWSYDGSLTTPPCTEGLKWSVVKQVQPISEAQLKRFTAVLADDDDFAGGKGNNRVVQPLNDRTLYFAKESVSGATYTMASLAVAASAIAALTF